MKVYKVRIGCAPDSSGGFGFMLTYPFACIIASILVSGCVYAAYRFGILGGENESENEGQT